MKNTININFGVDELFDKMCDSFCCSECPINNIVDEFGSCKAYFKEQLIKNNVNTSLNIQIL